MRFSTSWTVCLLINVVMTYTGEEKEDGGIPSGEISVKSFNDNTFDPFGYTVDSEPCKTDSPAHFHCTQACGDQTMCREFLYDQKKRSLFVCKCENEIRFDWNLKSHECGFVNLTRVLTEDFGMDMSSPPTTCSNPQELAYQKCGLQCEVMKDEESDPEGLYHGFLCFNSGSNGNSNGSYTCECVRKETQKLTSDVDTYGLRDACPYSRFFFPFPDSSSYNPTNPADSVSFRLYTNPKDTSDYDVIRLNDFGSLANSRFKNNGQLKVLIHGFRGGPDKLYPQNVKNAYLKLKGGTRNVLVVGWEDLARLTQAFIIGSYYKASVVNVPIVGRRLGEFLEFLVRNGKTQYSRMHLQGHSLGAHVAGVAGKYLSDRYSNIKVDRISGLDPAGPHFYSRLEMGRPLKWYDARFVDVVHTDQYLLGRAGRVGHADFVPDGGTLIQESCRHNISNILLDIFTLGSCSHATAHILFANSVGRWDIRGCRCANYNQFLSGRCRCSKGSKNEAIFGEHCNPLSRGNYFFNVKQCMTYSPAICS